MVTKMNDWMKKKPRKTAKIPSKGFEDCRRPIPNLLSEFEETEKPRKWNDNDLFVSVSIYTIYISIVIFLCSKKLAKIHTPYASTHHAVSNFIKIFDVFLWIVSSIFLLNFRANHKIILFDKPCKFIRMMNTKFEK